MSTAIGVSLPRLATAVGKAISEYAVLGKTPGFTADFIKNKYPGHTSLSSAITHARAGNATMTDGYGPELVTNGGFDSDSDWTTGTGWSIADGVASSDGSQSSSSALQAVDILTIGKTYVVTFTVVSRSAGTITPRAGTNGVGTGRTATGTYTEIITCAGTDDLRMTASNDFVGSIDNVSVREMPVLKWAPHNLLSYSEQFDNAYWNKNNVTVTANVTTAPDGSITADKITPNTSVASHRVTKVETSNVAKTFCVYAKPDGYSWIILQTPAGYAWFDVENGVIGTETSLITSNIEQANNGFYKCTVTSLSVANGTFYIWAVTQNGQTNFAGDGTSGVYIWGAHVYRSDLGGMVDNPDRGDSYVPTTSSAKYLPRIGHHVYNGSAWVNEGLLAESESRTNLETYSALPNAQWLNTQSATVEDQAVSPSGLEDAIFLRESSGTGTHRTLGNPAPTVGTTYTFSVYAKKKERTIFSIGGAGLYASNELPEFDVDNGIAYNGGTGNATVNIQDVGNGWFRCSATFTATGTSAFIIQLHDSLVNSAPPASSGKSYTGDGTSGMYFWGAQLEATSSPPSSFIPTSGQQATREAESFTIPSANLPWSQSYGTEVSASSWTGSGWDTFTSTGDDFSANKSTAGGTDHAYSNTAVTVVNGQSVKIDVDFDTGTNTQAVIALSSTTNARSNTVTVDPSAGGTKSVTVTATQSGTFSISVRTTQTGTINVTGARAAVVTNDPVSIAMDGRMTYADTDNSAEVRPFQWYAGGSKYIRNRVRTTGFRTGQLYFSQREATSGLDEVFTLNTYFSPDILVPYNLAGRHGSTFINGAESGVALTADTTPTALPDLSATDLSLAQTYMGTVGTFRVWDKDLGDDGIVEATNPSLEPSLSLTFEGTGTNSFVVNNWAE
jgi:hypothetical protein